MNFPDELFDLGDAAPENKQPLLSSLSALSPAMRDCHFRSRLLSVQ
jgi:hypothetical protein